MSSNLKAVYILREPNRGYIKVGITATPEDRFKGINNLSGLKVKLVHRTPIIKNSKVIETKVLEHFKEFNFSGEWLDTNVEDAVEYLKSLEPLYDHEDYTPLSMQYTDREYESVSERIVNDFKQDLIDTGIEGIYRDEKFQFYVYYLLEEKMQEIKCDLFKTAKEFKKLVDSRLIYTDKL